MVMVYKNGKPSNLQKWFSCGNKSLTIITVRAGTVWSEWWVDAYLIVSTEVEITSACLYSVEAVRSSHTSIQTALTHRSSRCVHTCTSPDTRVTALTAVNCISTARPGHTWVGASTGWLVVDIQVAFLSRVTGVVTCAAVDLLRTADSSVAGVSTVALLDSLVHGAGFSWWAWLTFTGIHSLRTSSTSIAVIGTATHGVSWHHGAGLAL